MKTLHESDNKLTLKQLQAKGNQVRVRSWVAAHQCGEEDSGLGAAPKGQLSKNGSLLADENSHKSKLQHIKLRPPHTPPHAIFLPQCPECPHTPYITSAYAKGNSMVETEAYTVRLLQSFPNTAHFCLLGPVSGCL